MDLARLIRAVPDFPEKGILFRDITPLLGHPAAMEHVLACFEEAALGWDAGVVLAIESRGFIFGAPLAARMGLPLVPVRKPGKLPAARMSVEYSLEYGQDRLDIHADAFPPGSRVVVVDDLLATGGTAGAAARLVRLLRGEVAGFCFVVELRELDGRRLLNEPILSLVSL